MTTVDEVSDSPPPLNGSDRDLLIYTATRVHAQGKELQALRDDVEGGNGSKGLKGRMTRIETIVVVGMFVISVGVPAVIALT